MIISLAHETMEHLWRTFFKNLRTPSRPSETPIRIIAESVGAHAPGRVSRIFSGARMPSGNQIDHAMTKVKAKNAGMGLFFSQFKNEANIATPFGLAIPYA